MALTELFIVAMNVALSVLLFFLVNWIGRNAVDFGYKSITLFDDAEESLAVNFAVRVVSPAAFITLASTIFIQIGLPNLRFGILYTSISYYVLRVGVIFVLDRQLLVRWTKVVIYSGSGLILSALAYKYLILPGTPLIPDLKTAGNELWLALAGFLYAVTNNAKISGGSNARHKNQYVKTKYEEYRRRYGSKIDAISDPLLELLAFSILIFEGYNRPRLVQKIERVLHPWAARTIGPMQTATDNKLNDVAAVELGISRIKTAASLVPLDDENRDLNIVSEVLADFNQDSDYRNNVESVMEILARRVEPRFRKTYIDTFGSS